MMKMWLFKQEVGIQNSVPWSQSFYLLMEFAKIFYGIRKINM